MPEIKEEKAAPSLAESPERGRSATPAGADGSSPRKETGPTANLRRRSSRLVSAGSAAAAPAAAAAAEAQPVEVVDIAEDGSTESVADGDDDVPTAATDSVSPTVAATDTADTDTATDTAATDTATDTADVDTAATDTAPEETPDTAAADTTIDTTATTDTATVTVAATDSRPAQEEPSSGDSEAEFPAVPSGPQPVTKVDEALYAWMLGRMGSKKAAETFGIGRMLLRGRRDAMTKEQRVSFVKRMRKHEQERDGGSSKPAGTPSAPAARPSAPPKPAKPKPSFAEALMMPEAVLASSPGRGVAKEAKSDSKELALLSEAAVRNVLSELSAGKSQATVSARHGICRTWLTKFMEERDAGRSPAEIHRMYVRTATARRDEQHIARAVSLVLKGHSVKKIARQSNLGVNVLKYHLKKHRERAKNAAGASADQDTEPDAGRSARPHRNPRRKPRRQNRHRLRPKPSDRRTHRLGLSG